MQVKHVCEKLKEETNAQNEYIRKMLKEMADRYYSSKILKTLKIITRKLKKKNESNG